MKVMYVGRGKNEGKKEELYAGGGNKGERKITKFLWKEGGKE